MEGIVFDIQRFSLDDGPGIRTVVFLQGCNLRCPWCHNPESCLDTPVVMRSTACTSCGRCAAVCPEKILRVDGSMIDRSRCTLCGECVKACPQSARRISGKTYSAQSLLEILLRDKDYYEASGGGVTFSGGEPTHQWQFVAEMIALLKQEGISCAIETNSLIPHEGMEALLNGLDYAMIDLKHSDTDAHKRLLGVGNEMPVASIRSFAAQMPVEVRTPVIPGFNDSADALRGVIETAQRCGARTVRFLPYHVFGTQKYRGLDIPYHYDNVAPLTKDSVRALIGETAEYAIEIKI